MYLYHHKVSLIQTHKELIVDVTNTLSKVKGTRLIITVDPVDAAKFLGVSSESNILPAVKDKPIVSLE